MEGRRDQKPRPHAYPEQELSLDREAVIEIHLLLIMEIGKGGDPQHHGGSQQDERHHRIVPIGEVQHHPYIFDPPLYHLRHSHIFIRLVRGQHHGHGHRQGEEQRQPQKGGRPGLALHLLPEQTDN